MNPRRLILALVFALGVSGIFTYWLSRRFSAKTVAAPPKHQYVAASINLDAGEVLRPAALKMIDWPETAQLQGAFANPKDLEGRVVIYPLAEGQPILDRQLAAPGSGAGLTVKIPEGMRAISLRSDDVVGVAGFLLPGTYVDVLVTYHTVAAAEPITATILQDAEVLAAGQKFQPDPEGKATSVDVVTLLVTPEDAEKVVLASSQGLVHFVLRNGTDKDKAKNNAVQLSQLEGGAPPPSPLRPSTMQGPVRVPRAAPSASYTIETINGNKSSTESFK
jgi:pilus assembly protein CpaB